MSIADEALERLVGNHDYICALAYSGRFGAYNANVKKSGRKIFFSLSKKWRGVSREIVIGLIQGLLIRLLKLPKQQTLNMDLYDSFVKSLKKTNLNASADETLQTSFHRVNERYFNSVLQLPNMAWGNDSRRKLASYDHHTDTVVVSSLFKKAPAEILDYLVYHELLHKKLQFITKRGRSVHHGREFRKWEKKFENEDIEQEIEMFLKGKAFRRCF